MPSPGEDLHADFDGGWLLPPPAPRRPVHTRSILCRSFRRDDGQLEIDARFIDTRPFAYDNDFRGRCEEGSALHNIQLRVTFDRSRHITALVSAMKSTPYDTCAGVQPNFQALVGLSLGKGFKKALRERLDGVQGCTHVLAIMEAVAAAAVQTFASNAYVPRAPGEPEPVRIWRIEALRDTCHSYRSGGPIMQKMEARAAAQAAAAGPAPAADAAPSSPAAST